MSRLGHGRDANRARVLRELTILGTTSRAQIARRTGLSPSTVSAIVATLQRDGLVVEQTLVDGPGPRGGRPASGIALHRDAGVAVGVDFGKRHLAVAVCDLGHEVLAETWQEMDEDYPADHGLKSARELIACTLQQAHATTATALGVGIGLPGPVHATSGTLGSSTILPGWSGVRLGDVERHFELPVYIDNDANLGARAESVWGAGRGIENFVFVKVATGIGSGLIVNGQVLSGVGGTAGEIGHIGVEPDGDICRCGSRGCLETVASGPALVRMLERALDQTLEPEEIIRRAREGDLACARALGDAGRHIGAATATLCNLFNPQRIAVGGSLGAAGDLLLNPMRESLELRAIPSAAADAEIVQAELGERAELLGALALVLDKASELAGQRTNQLRGGVDAR
ncbi:MAG TPA: ROK family transcriptional regulator [Thermoleophilaceae bacterium]